LGDFADLVGAGPGNKHLGEPVSHLLFIALISIKDLGKEHWKTIRTNNVSERLFEEVKRRSHKMAAAFRNEGSWVLLFYAVIRSLKFHTLAMPAAS